MAHHCAPKCWCGSVSVVKLLVPLLVCAGLVATSSVCAKPREQHGTKPIEVDNFCDVCGEGYHGVPGTDVCVKVSGYISTTVGVSRGGPESGKPTL